MISKDERNVIVENNMGLAKKAVDLFGRKYLETGCTYVTQDDLLQTAYIALCKAAEYFDESYGVKFSSYAMKTMYRELYTVYHGLLTPKEITMSDEYLMEKEEFSRDNRNFSISQNCQDPADYVCLRVSFDNLIKNLPHVKKKTASRIITGIQIIHLRDKGLTIKEAADVLDIDFNKAKSVYQIAKLFLKENEYLFH